MTDPREITLRHRAPEKDTPETRNPVTWDRPGSEEADSYGRVVVQLSARARVIVCRNDIQWIYQRRDGKRHGAPRWAGRSCLRTRKQLIAVLRASQTPLDPSALAILEALPESFRQHQRAKGGTLLKEVSP